MGDSQQQIANTVGHSLITGAPATGPAAPFVAAAGALANIVSLFGPNPNNDLTTGWVNEIEADVLKPNLKAWQALAPQDKTQAMQQYAESVFLNSWNQIVSLCRNPQLGSAGTNCIADRQRGGKTDWFGYYYDPIASDPQVSANEGQPSYSDETGSTPAGSPAATTADNTNLYFGLGLLAAGVLVTFMGGSK